MRIGISSYCLDRDMEKGGMTLFDVIDWAAKYGAEIMELVPFAFTLGDETNKRVDKELIHRVVCRAKDAGIFLSNYSVLADFCKEGEELRREIDRVKFHVDIACEIGVPMMRHDVTAFRRPLSQNTLSDFERWLPVLADAAGEISLYAKKKGVFTLIENHGFFANGCDRVEQILNRVNTGNYGLLLDTGNIICVDEDPVSAAVTLAKRAKMVHLKDFYIRHRDPGDTTQFDCGGHWFRSRAGKYLRGAILAQGDIDIYAVIKALKDADYQGDVAIEFEGLEDAKYATGVSLANARRIYQEV